MKTADTLLRLPSAQQRGFGVVEIMVAVAISLFLLAGLYTVFLNAKSSYDTQQGLSLLQENARYAMSRLTKVIRMAGFNGEGCSRVLNHGGPNTGTPYVEGFNTSPNGTSWAPALPARLSPSQLTHSPAPGSDVIEVNTVYGPVTTLTSPITTNNSLYHFAVDNKYNLQSGDRVQLSNCFNATPITISRIDGKKYLFSSEPLTAGIRRRHHAAENEVAILFYRERYRREKLFTGRMRVMASDGKQFDTRKFLQQPRRGTGEWGGQYAKRVERRGIHDECPDLCGRGRRVDGIDHQFDHHASRRRLETAGAPSNRGSQQHAHVHQPQGLSSLLAAT